MKKIQIISLVAGVAILAGCSSYREKMGYAKPVAFEDLPQPAQQTIRNEIGNRQITKIDQDVKNGQTAYRVQVEKTGGVATAPVLWVTPTGAVLKKSSSLQAEKGIVNEPAGAEAPPAEAPPMRTDPDYQ